MSHVTMEPTILDKLLAAHELVEVRDSDGKVVGHFIPLKSGPDADTVRTLFDLEKARATLKKQHDQGRPLQEIWASLRSREGHG